MDAIKYFDELHNYGMGSSRVNSRKTIYRAMKRAIEDDFDLFLLDMYNGGWLTEHQPEYYENIVLQSYIDVARKMDGIDISDRDFVLHSNNFAKHIVDSVVNAWNTAAPDDETTQSDFRTAQVIAALANENPNEIQIIQDQGFTEKRLTGMPLTKDEIPKSVLKVLDGDRATLIGTDQSLYINDTAEYRKAVDSGVSTKTWNSMEDDRVRNTHRAVDLVTIPIDEPFHVGDSYLMYPRDDSLDASPEEIINCRCFLT